MIGRVIAGRYRITQKLGQGAMGSVYLGEWSELGQRVALKFLSSHLSNDPSIAQRFLNEAKSYARITHPHAVMLHDFGQDEEGNLYISMEWVEGHDLGKMLRERGRLPLGEAAQIILQVADVLAYAHTRGVVHRDLKPENIMVRPGPLGPFVKVLDFGIAKLVEGNAAPLTVQGLVAGTPQYMPPEQAEGNEIDGRADIYSLGLVLVELISGIAPFGGGTLSETLRKQLTQPTPHLKDLGLDSDLALDGVIQRATAKHRDERYRTMEEFAADLSRAAARDLAKSPNAESQAPLEATLVTAGGRASVPAPRAKEIRPRSRLPVVLGGLALLVGVVGAGAFLSGLLNAVALAPSAQKPGGNVQTKPVDSTAASAIAPVATSGSPAGGQRSADSVALGTIWQGVYIRAKGEFAVGKIDDARALMATIPKENADAEMAKFSENLSEIAAKFARAKKLVDSGDCANAIKMYDSVLKVNPDLKVAQEARQKCQRMLVPATLE